MKNNSNELLISMMIIMMIMIMSWYDGEWEWERLLAEWGKFGHPCLRG